MEEGGGCSVFNKVGKADDEWVEVSGIGRFAESIIRQYTGDIIVYFDIIVILDVVGNGFAVVVFSW